MKLPLVRKGPLALVLAMSAVSAVSFVASADCVLPDAPQAFLDIIQKPRTIQANYGDPEHTRLYNPISQKNDIPNLLSSCRVRSVSITGDDPLTHQPRQVTVASYANEGTFVENLRTILLIPPTGGENALDDSYADYLCRQGFRVVMLQHWAGDSIAEVDMGMHDRGTMRATAAVEDVIEFIHPKKPEQLGILGTSVGAISAGLMLGVDYRISTGVLIVGGTDMPDIIAKSSEKTLAALRTQRLAAYRLNDIADYERALKEQIKIEPLKFESFAQRKNILFFMALQDLTVPTIDQRKLYHALGDQELVTYDADHFHTILHTSWAERVHIGDYFKAHLVEPTASEIVSNNAKAPVENKLCLNAK